MYDSNSNLQNCNIFSMYKIKPEVQFTGKYLNSTGTLFRIVYRLNMVSLLFPIRTNISITPEYSTGVF